MKREQHAHTLAFGTAVQRFSRSNQLVLLQRDEYFTFPESASLLFFLMSTLGGRATYSLFSGCLVESRTRTIRA